MATIAIQDFTGYTFPSTGGTLVLTGNSYAYFSASINLDTIDTVDITMNGEPGTVVEDNGIYDAYVESSPGDEIILTITTSGNSAGQTVLGNIYFYENGVEIGSCNIWQEASVAPSRYYANITGAANISVPVNPSAIYSGNSNHITLEFNGDNLRTDAVRNNGAVWIRTSGNWFSFEMYGEGWEYLNLGSSTYIGRYAYWSTNGFESTFVVDINDGSVTLTKGQQTSATTFGGGITAPGMTFFHSTYGTNVRMNFYRLAIYGGDNKTLLYDFVPDYDGTTKGLRDRVSGNFYSATNQSYITLVSLRTFEVNTDTITSDYSGTSTSVIVTADSDLAWTASTSDSWISITNPTGSGNGSFTVVVSENRDHSGKTGSVTVTSSDGDVLTISVSQERMPSLISQKPLCRNGNSVIKMYRSGELIYLKVNPQTTPPEPPTPTGYTNMPLTFEITKAGNLRWYTQNGSYTKTIEYKKNDGEWTQITSSNAGTLIPVEVGDIVQLRGDNAQYAPQDGRCSCWCGTTANYKMYGNIMSLIDSTGFTTLSSFTQANVFMNFFNSGGCIDAENLILPATALTDYCYQGMLAQSNNLEIGPLLPVETLVQGCYAYLFYHSYQINNIRCLATNISASRCLDNWTNGVASVGTFYKNPNMSSWGRGSSAVPNNWTLTDYTE